MCGVLFCPGDRLRSARPAHPLLGRACVSWLWIYPTQVTLPDLETLKAMWHSLLEICGEDKDHRVVDAEKLMEALQTWRAQRYAGGFAAYNTHVMKILTMQRSGVRPRPATCRCSCTQATILSPPLLPPASVSSPAAHDTNAKTAAEAAKPAEATSTDRVSVLLLLARREPARVLCRTPGALHTCLCAPAACPAAPLVACRQSW
jgi:hypothetical protein